MPVSAWMSQERKKKNPKDVIFYYIALCTDIFDFRFNTPTPSLKQGRVFRVRKCAQSIPRIEKPPGVIFSAF
jgi:hypothetical protein